MTEEQAVSKTIDDGGPAFPETRWEDLTHQEMQWTGMTLRDWFAGQAVTGWLASPESDKLLQRCEGNLEDALNRMSQASYMLADAMIATRKGGEA